MHIWPYDHSSCGQCLSECSRDTCMTILAVPCHYLLAGWWRQGLLRDKPVFPGLRMPSLTLLYVTQSTTTYLLHFTAVHSAVLYCPSLHCTVLRCTLWTTQYRTIHFNIEFTAHCKYYNMDSQCSSVQSFTVPRLPAPIRRSTATTMEAHHQPLSTSGKFGPILL